MAVICRVLGISRACVAGSFPSLPFATVRNATYTFDARGKLKTGSDLARFLQQDAATYSGLGYLTQSGLHQNWVNGWGRDNVYGVTETFQTDALGNQVAHSTVDTVSYSGGWNSTTTGAGPYRYKPATAQLDSLSGHAYNTGLRGNEWVESGGLCCSASPALRGTSGLAGSRERG